MNKVIYGAIAALALFSSCKKDELSNPSTPASTTLTLDIDYVFSDSSFALGQVYNLPGSTHTVQISTANFYLANLSLVTDEGEDIVPGDIAQHYIVKPEASSFELGAVSADHVHILSMVLGVDSLTNKTVQPSDFSDLNEPLAPQVPSMYWSWNSGYIFLRVEGMIDTNGDGNVDAPFEYHLGMDAMRRSFSTMIHENLSQGVNNEIHLTFDVSKLFDGLDPSVDLATHTMDNMMLATKIADNWAMSFSHD